MKNFRARVVAVHRTLVHLHTSDAQLVTASPSMSYTQRSQLAKQDHAHDPPLRPTVGDWVNAEWLDPQHCRIVDIEPRSSTIVRRSAGAEHQPQMLAANVDTAFILSPLPESPSVRRLARLVALALAGNVIPVIVLSRIDTVDGQQVTDAMHVIAQHLPNVAVVATSSTSDGGLVALTPWLWPGATVVMLGTSGAGKSTMLNALAGESVMKTGATRSDGAGRHTTTHRALVELASGIFVIDTPGLREVGVWATQEVSDLLFGDIAELGEQCRFRNCTHMGEPGCAVQNAIRDGAVTSERWAQWEQLRREAAFVDRSESERRRRERQGSLAMRRFNREQR